MKFIDLFAGIGGFRRGMELAGHECVGFCEWDKFATASYISMHLITNKQREYLSTLDLKKRQKEILKDEYRNGEWYSNDIRNVDAGSVPKADCWCFGAPCQDFSIAGKRAGLNGDRSSLVREVFRILVEIEEKSRPEWLIYENVKGMLSSNRGFDFLEILLAMDELGYDCEWQIFNSKDWGVPQNRERVYTVGHLRSRGAAKIFPITGADGENCIQKLGNYLPTRTRGNPNQGRIYSIEGIGPCLNKMDGGGREPSVAIPFFMDLNIGAGIKETEFARCLQSRYQKGMCKFECGISGIGIPISDDDIDTNPLFNQRGIVHSVNGISRTVLGCGHSGNEPKVAIPVTLGANVVKNEIEIDHCLNANDSRKFLGKKQDETAVCIPVLTPDRVNKCQNGRRFKEDGEPMFTLTGQDRHGVGVSVYDMHNKSARDDGLCGTLTSSGNTSTTHCGSFGVIIPVSNDKNESSGIYVRFSDELIVYAIWCEKYQCYIAIRKLTPKECFRLQGWTDDYFEKAQFVNSDSQLYKQAGNGVTVNVVYEIGSRIPI